MCKPGNGMGVQLMETISPLDPEQLQRIEGVHRGFLYQHLYTAGTLLISAQAGLTSVLVEHDEDLELITEDKHVYVQVKTRQRSLRPSDIDGALQRFDRLRRCHDDGVRDREAEFWLVSNASVGPRLQKEIDALKERGIRIASPGEPDSLPPYVLPPCRSIAQLAASCEAKAKDIPWLCIRSNSLVWKLAAMVQLAASGANPEHPHIFKISDLPTLLEQVAEHLQNFPASPSPYYAQDNEPSFFSAERVRLMLGLSGSGKTSWVAEAAKQWTAHSVYFDVGDTPDAAVATAVAREIAGHLFRSDGDSRSRTLFLGKSGQEQLRLIDAILCQQDRDVVLVIDNVHHAEAPTIAAMVSSMSRVTWLLIGQPTPSTKEIEHLLHVTPEKFKGWSTDTVSGVFRDMGVPIDWGTANKVSRLTGRLPLYVIGMARLAHTSAGSVEDFIQAVESGQHTTVTTQEAILRRVHTALPDHCKAAAGALSTCDTPLERDEVLTVISALSEKEGGGHAASLRHLAEWGVLQVLQDGRITLHDAYRTLASEEFLQWPSKTRKRTLSALRDVLLVSLDRKPDTARAVLLMKVLADLGESKALVDLATGSDEIIVELGLLEQIRPLLEHVASDESANAVDRFWTMDSLAYWDYQAGRLEQFKKRVEEMPLILAEASRGSKERTTLAIRQMLIAAREGNLEAAQRLFTQAAEDNVDNPEVIRVLRYDLALALFYAKRHKLVVEKCEELIEEYFAVLELSPEDVAFANPPEIWAKLRKGRAVEDDLKRLADTLYLHELALRELGRMSPLGLLHAHKFYVMSSSFASAIRSGQEAVDQLLGVEPLDAKRLIEQTLLPVIREIGLAEYVLPVRSQYAVVLAYCGEKEAALTEIATLKQFKHGDDSRQEEFERQCVLVHDILAGRVKLPRRNQAQLQPQVPLPQLPVSGKVGRNEPCPCGSGKKYKRCCLPKYG